MTGLGWPQPAVASPPSAARSGLGWPVQRSPVFHVEPDPDQDAQPKPDAEREADAEPEADADAEPEAEPEPDADPDAEVEPEPAEPGLDAEPGPDGDTGVERAPGADDEAARRIRGLLADDGAPGGTVADPTRAGELSPAQGEDETPIGAAAAAAVRLRSRRREPFPRPATRRVLSIANQKGGVGKTTTTVNLAVALAQHGAKVLVVDLDPQGNASTGLGVEHHIGVPDVYDVLINGVAIAEVVQPAGDVEGCWAVPATIDLAGAEIELVPAVVREWRLHRALEAYCAGPGADLDYVLIDCPPSLGLLTLNAMVAARELLIPIQCEYYALEGLGQLLRTVEMVKAHLSPGLSLSTILLTMHDARTRLADQVAAEVRAHFGEVVLDVTIPRSVRVSEAPGYGKSVVAYDPGSRGARAYVAAARQLAERGAAPAGGTGPVEEQQT